MFSASDNSSSCCSTLEKLALEDPTKPILVESSLDKDSYNDLPILTHSNVLKSEVEVISSLKASMLTCWASVLTEDFQHLKSKMRALEQVNDRFRKDVKFCQGKLHINICFIPFSAP